ncbi:MAG: ABC transporter ATP-binding protein/permease [Candidatus Omnitrophica bacterium]|nr:ABC transporter ATP-binding protein/permease [Candidatus Omnitrophota bacterium]
MTYIENLKKKIRILYYFFSPSTLMLVILVVLTIIYGLIEMAAVGAIFPVLEAGVEGISLQKIDTVGLLNVRAWYLKVGMVFGFNNYLLISSIFLISITLFSFMYKTFYAYFNQKVLAYLWVYHQKRIYSALSLAEYAFYTNEKQGKIIYNSAVASESIAAVIDSLIRGISETVKGLFLIGLMFINSWIITFIVVIVGIMYILFSRVIIRVMVNKPSAESLILKQKQHQNMNEFITGIKLIKVFNRTEFWKSQYTGMAEKNAKLLIKMQMGSLFPSFIIQMIIGIGIGIGGIYIGSHSKETFIRVIPLLGLFVITSNRINGAISIAISYFAAIARHFPNLTACYEIINKTPIILQGKRSETKFSFKKEIAFDNVSFSYEGYSNKIIRNISFVIPKNKTIALVGMSGGGKTTILNLLLRLFENYSGKILFDNIDIRSIDRDSYYNALGFVSQEQFLFNGTVFENVSFGMEASLEEVMAACKKADACEFIENLDMGYDSVVGDSGIKLSGGQKQRIGIARALLKKPQLLILDEPTSALDNESELRIQETLGKLSKSLTVLIVAHRLSTIQNADKIIVLKDSCIVEEGLHRELIMSNGYYSELYNQVELT